MSGNDIEGEYTMKMNEITSILEMINSPSEKIINGEVAIQSKVEINKKQETIVTLRRHEYSYMRYEMD